MFLILLCKDINLILMSELNQQTSGGGLKLLRNTD